MAGLEAAAQVGCGVDEQLGDQRRKVFRLRALGLGWTVRWRQVFRLGVTIAGRRAICPVPIGWLVLTVCPGLIVRLGLVICRRTQRQGDDGCQIAAGAVARHADPVCIDGQ